MKRLLKLLTLAGLLVCFLSAGGYCTDLTVAYVDSLTGDDTTVTFSVTDGKKTIVVVHAGAPQQLFAEGIGVVVEGTWNGDIFSSDSMIIKHDEQYRTEDGGVYTPDQRFPDA